MELLDPFTRRGYPNEIGPGLWDVHLPRVSSPDELDELVGTGHRRVRHRPLWVNPDCGLKTRGWTEVEASLANLTASAARARARVLGMAEAPRVPG
ncbi:MAG TPA: hypothetical protein VK975_06905 [Acidimicrobiales bacterium]|nr:hypothetical protein [Acidimicrobiales bacterium]